MKFWKWHFIFEFVPILHFTVIEEYLKRNSLVKLTCEMTQKYSRFKSLYYLRIILVYAFGNYTGL